jgi:hypothetical protein
MLVSKMEQKDGRYASMLGSMSSKRSLLCMHKDLIQLQQRKLLLERNGYMVLTANTDQDAMAMLGSARLDAVVFEWIGDFGVAKKMKLANARVPIVMVANTLDLPERASDSIDALVGEFDGDQFLLDTLHFLLEVKPSQLSHDGLGDTQDVRNNFARRTASTWRSRVLAS